jgi:DNA mismatch repair ATPase MutS
MLLDSAAIDSLEVVRPLQPIPSTCHGAAAAATAPGGRGNPHQRRAGGRAGAEAAASAAAKWYACLLSFFNHTTTSSGARLLRSNLLQPLKDVASIELRLDALQVSKVVCLTASDQGDFQ